MDRVGLVVQRITLAIALAAGLVASAAQAATSTVTYQLGGSGGGTYFAAGTFKSWLAKGTLPTGSILRSVTVNAKLESTTNGNWANDLMVMVDPTPLTPGGDSLLAIGNGDSMGPAWNLTWDSGYGGPGTALSDTMAAPADFPATMDLHAAEVFLGNSYTYASGTWSGTVTIAYDSPDMRCWVRHRWRLTVCWTPAARPPAWASAATPAT